MKTTLRHFKYAVQCECIYLWHLLPQCGWCFDYWRSLFPATQPFCECTTDLLMSYLNLFCDFFPGQISMDNVHLPHYANPGFVFWTDIWVQNVVLICRRIKWESTSETMWGFQIVCVSSVAPDRCWWGATWVPWQNHQWFSLVNYHRCLNFCGLVPTFNRFLMSLSSGLHQIKEKWLDECLPICFLVCNYSSIEWEQSPLCSWFLVWASLTWLWTLPKQNL